MALDFVKNASNFLSYGVATFNPFLSGASKVVISALINADTFDTAVDNNNKILQISINGSSSGITFSVNAVGVNDLIRIAARSVSTDSLQALNGVTAITTGTWFHVGAIIDYAGDSLSTIVNGAVDTTSGVSFGNTTYTPGAPTVTDRIGADSDTPVLTPGQFDGRIAEIAVWTFSAAEDVLVADELAALAKYFSPLMIRPSNLVFYEPFISRQTTIPDKVNGIAGTITGTLNYADHPSTIFRHSRQSFVPSTQTIPLSFSTDVVRSAAVTRSSLLNAVIPVVHTLVKSIIGELNRSTSVIRSVLSSVDLPTITSISVSVTRTVSAAATFASVATAIAKFTGTAGLGLLLRPVSRWTRRPKRR